MAINRNVMNKAREHASAMDMPGEAQPLVVPHQLRYRQSARHFRIPNRKIHSARMISEALPEFPPVPWSMGPRAHRGVRRLCPTSRLVNRITVDVRQMQMRIKGL